MYKAGTWKRRPENGVWVFAEPTIHPEPNSRRVTARTSSPLRLGRFLPGEEVTDLAYQALRLAGKLLGGAEHL